jgi:hypothetical protein
MIIIINKKIYKYKINKEAKQKIVIIIVIIICSDNF